MRRTPGELDSWWLLSCRWLALALAWLVLATRPTNLLRPEQKGQKGVDERSRTSREGEEEAECTRTAIFCPCDCDFLRDSKITSTSTERRKRSQNLAPVLVTMSRNSLVFSGKVTTSTEFYRCCAPGASAPVVVKNHSPKISTAPQTIWKKGKDPHPPRQDSASGLY